MLNLDFRCTVLSNPTSKLVAFCDLVIDNSILVSGWKIFKTDDGRVFAKSPSQKSSKPKPDGSDDYIDTTRFLDAKASDEDKLTPLQKEIYDGMVSAYKAATGGGSSTDTPTAKKAGAAVAKKGNPRLWGMGE